MRKFGLETFERAAFFFVALAFFLPATINTARADAAPGMIVPGKHDVTASGAFTYTIPIAVPPGTAGMAPSLSLDYSSQGGDGFEGLGWSISGLPAITRCPRTLAQDGVHGSVNFDANDRFCLQGERLVPLGTTAMTCPGGVTVTEYRTEIDSYSRIISCGNTGSGQISTAGPTFFKAWTKTGQIVEFGNTPDSQGQLVPVSGATTGVNGTIRSWSVNKISDTVGNYLTVTYDKGMPDTVNGQVYPTEIDYTANDGQHVAAYNSVQFSYTDPGVRNDVVPMYQAGAVSSTAILLTHVTTYRGTGTTGLTAVTDYRVAYQYANSGDQHDELSSVTQCDGTASGAKCLKPTSFSWQGSRDVLTMTKQALGFVQGSYEDNRGYIFPGDYDGDGLTDIAAGNNKMGAAGCNIFFGQPAGTQMGFVASDFTAEKYNGSTWVAGPACFSGVATQPRYLPRFMDFDGNGLSDVLARGAGPGSSIAALRNDGQHHLVHTDAPGLYDDTFVGDFNGDGFTDVLGRVQSDDWFNIFTSNGSGHFVATSIFYDNDDTMFMGDFDGDGCTDIMQQRNKQEIDYSPLCNSRVGWYGLRDWSPGDDGDQVIVGDFNGDGKTDYIGVHWFFAVFDIELMLSTGTSFTVVNNALPQSFGNFSIETGDFNGDGKTDLLLIADDMPLHANQWVQEQVWLSTGTGFVQAKDASGNPILLDSGNDTDKPVNHIANIRGVEADFNNDGASDIWIQKPSGDQQYSFAYTPELINKVTNGIGTTTLVTYDRLNENGAFYTKCPGGPCNDTFPTSGMDGAFYAVSRIDSSNGIGGNYSSTYAYGGAKIDSHGRGLLGFQTVSVTDLQTHVIHTTNYRTDYPFVGLIASETKLCPRPYCNSATDVVLSTTTNLFQGNADCTNTLPTGPIYKTYLCQTVAASNDLDNSPLPSTETDYSHYSMYGDAGQVIVSTTPAGASSPDAIKQTNNTFTTLVDSTHWCLARMTNATVRSTWQGVTKIRRSGFEYDVNNGAASTCLLTKEIVEPAYASTPLWQETDYGYDGFGNRTFVTQIGCADAVTPACTLAAPRVTRTDFDANGEFAITVTNAAQQVEHWTFDPAFGAVLTHIGPNGLRTSNLYDTFGRKTKSVNSDNTYSTIAYNYCDDAGISCPANAAFLATAGGYAVDGTQNGPAGMTYFDMLSRGITTDLQGFDGSWIRSDTLYDGSGHVAQTDRPYFRGTGGIVPCADQHTACTTYAYDDIGRVVSATAPDQSVTQTAYSGMTQTVTNALGEISTSVKNDLGQIASVTDALALGHADPAFQHTVQFGYDPFGDKTTVTDPAGNVTTTVFDLRGRKTRTADPDMGTWTYVYDSFGELIAQSDPNEAHNGTGPTTLAYDVLGRTTDRVEPDMVSHWDYDGATNGIGKVQDVTCTGAACAGGAAFTRTYQYDLKGRQSRLTVAVGTQSYFATTSYDANTGRMAQSRAFSTASFAYSYNVYGFLFEIDDANNLATAYWKANTRDAELHVISQTAANGVTTTENFDPQTGRILAIHAGHNDKVANFAYDWDTLGDLTQRTDMLAVTGGQTENFCYDKLNRLTNATLGTSCNGPVQHYQYDALGNITSKYDAGLYTYSQQHPHAVASINTSANQGLGQGCMVPGGCAINGVQNPTFTYDRDGNMTGGAGRTVTYTAANMTATVSEGTTALTLGYDPDHQRIQQVVTAGATTTTTTYLNDTASNTMTERVAQPGSGGTTWKTYIVAEGRIVAVRNSQGSTVALRYFVLDHLGSVAVVTDETGLVVDGGRFFYDAWGKMRNADGSADTSCSLPAQARTSAQTARGYTGQEQMPEVCLVNYNARIYDPQIGRFLNPDSQIESPYDLQDLNRYTYVTDNPLSLTDPSGHGFLTQLFSALITIVIAVYAPELLGPWANAGVLMSAAANGDLAAIGFTALEGAVTGGISAAMNGGDIVKGVLFGGLSGALMSGMGARFGMELGGVLHSSTAGAFIGMGFVGGLSSAIQGGNFGSGFLAAGVGSLGGALGDGSFNAGRMIASSLIGGAASVLGGGKFANGALSAAFSYAVGTLNQDPVAEEKPSETYSEYMHNCIAQHVNCANTSVPSNVAKIIEHSMNSAEFTNMATPMYNDAVRSQLETEGIQAYYTGSLSDPDHLVVTFFAYKGASTTCSGASPTCMTPPPPEGAHPGTPLFEWHPHPLSGESTIYPSEADLKRSLAHDSLPGVIWANAAGGRQTIIYEGHPCPGMSGTCH